MYNKLHPPCEDELAARRRGEPWNEQIKQQLIKNVSYLRQILLEINFMQIRENSKKLRIWSQQKNQKKSYQIVIIRISMHI